MLNLSGLLLKKGMVDLTLIGNTESGNKITHLEFLLEYYADGWGGSAKYMSKLTEGFAFALAHQFSDLSMVNTADEFIIKLKEKYPVLFDQDHIQYLKKGFEDYKKWLGNCLKDQSIDKYVMMVLHSDDFFQLPESNTTLEKNALNAYNFFKITKSIPLELQMKIARFTNQGTYNNPDDMISTKESESAFKKVLNNKDSSQSIVNEVEINDTTPAP